MKIILNGTKKASMDLMTAIRDAEGRATARTLTEKRILQLLAEVDKNIGIAKAKMKGIKVSYTGAEKFPQAYKYTPDSTQFSAEHNGRYWVVTGICRYTCPNRSSGALEVKLTDAAKDAILKKYTLMF